MSSAAISDAKRRVLDRLKRGALTAPELAAELGLTEAAVRQHLDALAEHGLVASAPRTGTGERGRPPLVWTLTAVAAELFPDRHADLTVELIEAVRAAVGERGLEKVIEVRSAQQLAAYRAVIPNDDGVALRKRVEALARQRSAEGYMAEVTREGDALVLVEHHCPVCAAATACQGLCRGELELFRAALGAGVSVERSAHLLSGDERCAYTLRSV